MDKSLETTLHAAHVALQTETGKEAVKAVGAAVITTAAPLLATPAAPLVVGAAAIAGAYLGGKKLWKWLNT